MTIKVDIFMNQFDKGFFGKKLLSYADKSVDSQPVKRVLPDSVSDLMKYFEQKMCKNVLERAPKMDTYEAPEDIVMFPDIIL